MRSEPLFPDVSKLGALYLTLGPDARENAEAAAVEAVAHYRRWVDQHPSLDTIREISTRAMFRHTVALCTNDRARAACGEAFGMAGRPFVPSADQGAASEPPADYPRHTRS